MTLCHVVVAKETDLDFNYTEIFLLVLPYTQSHEVWEPLEEHMCQPIAPEPKESAGI